MSTQIFRPADLHDGQKVPGPLPGLAGVRGPDTTLRLELDRPMHHQGTVTVWLQTGEATLNGQGVDACQRAILSSANHFQLGLQSDAICTQISGCFAENVWGISPALLPGLPAGQWLHLAYTWDAGQGAYDACLNGSPLRLPETPIKPWELPEVGALDLQLGDWPIAEVTISDQRLPADQLCRLTPKLYQGALDNLIGARSRGGFEVDGVRGETIYERSLGDAADVADWIMEGYAVPSFADGWMQMTSSRPDPDEGHGHSVFWCPKDFPADLVVEWEVQPISDYGLCIIFIAAKGVNGEDLFDPSLPEREGNFRHYIMGEVDSYHMSYYANTPFNPGRATCNMRKNSGFCLVDNGPPGVPAFSHDIHKVAVVKQGNHIRLAVDGRLIIDFQDDGRQYGPVHGGGKIGLRQMQWMTARYRNLRVSRLANGS